MSRTAWVIVALVVVVVLGVVILPLVGLAILFRHEIGVVVFGHGEPTSGTRLTYECEPLEGATSPDLERVCGVLRRRLGPRGGRGYVIRPAAAGFIEVLLPVEADVTDVKRLAASPGLLEFRIMADRQADRDRANFEGILRLKEAGQPPDDSRFKWYPVARGWEWYQQGLLDSWNFVYVVDKETWAVEALVDVSDGQDVTGKDLSRVSASLQDGEPIVLFYLKPEAGTRMARLTRPEMKDRQLAIILDGRIQSAPVLKATLSTGGIIEGYRNKVRERDEVVDILDAGCLGARLRLVGEESFGSVPSAP